LATTAVGGVLSGRPGPYAAVTVNNVAGSKLDYYLRRELCTRALAAPGESVAAASR
jgi:hypothetical protein